MHAFLRHSALAAIVVAGVIFSIRAPAAGSDACAVLTPADITKATGLTVGAGAAGAPIPGVLGKCTWPGEEDTKVILTLTDTQHMQTTIAAWASGSHPASAVPDLGTRAVINKGAGFTGGGYIVSVLDAKGGFGVSILGKQGTADRAIALAKLVESRR